MPMPLLTLNVDESTAHWHLKIINTNASMVLERLFTRVSDQHRFNADLDTDPDPAFFLIADPYSGSGSRV
jgi:hypothetical protein